METKTKGDITTMVKILSLATRMAFCCLLGGKETQHLTKAVLVSEKEWSNLIKGVDL